MVEVVAAIMAAAWNLHAMLWRIYNAVWRPDSVRLPSSWQGPHETEQADRAYVAAIFSFSESAWLPKGVAGGGPRVVH